MSERTYEIDFSKLSREDLIKAIGKIDDYTYSLEEKLRTVEAERDDLLTVNQIHKIEREKLEAERDRLKNLDTDYGKLYSEYTNVINDGNNLYLNKKLLSLEKIAREILEVLTCICVDEMECGYCEAKKKIDEILKGDNEKN